MSRLDWWASIDVPPLSTPSGNGGVYPASSYINGAVVMARLFRNFTRSACTAYCSAAATTNNARAYVASLGVVNNERHVDAVAAAAAATTQQPPPPPEPLVVVPPRLVCATRARLVAQNVAVAGVRLQRVAQQCRWNATLRVARAFFRRRRAPAPRVKTSENMREFFLRVTGINRVGSAVDAHDHVAAFMSLSNDDYGIAESASAAPWYLRLVGAWRDGRQCTRHRAALRWKHRMALLRELRSRMLFESSDIRRIRNPVNVAWAGNIARKVVSAARDAGEVDARASAWFRRALVTVYFLEDEDDAFLAGLEEAGQKWSD